MRPHLPMPAESSAGSNSPRAVIEDWSKRSGRPRRWANSWHIVPAVTPKTCPRWVVPANLENWLRTRMTPPEAAGSSDRKSDFSPRLAMPVALVMRKFSGAVSRLTNRMST